LVRVIVLLSLLISLSPSKGYAQFLCGTTNVFAQSTSGIKSLLREAGFAFMLGDSEFQCGMPGEDFKICRRCEKALPTDSFDPLRGMFARANFQNWAEQVKADGGPGSVSVSLQSFEQEKMMGHVRSGETRTAFQERVNEAKGENFLFANRSVYKMLQIELTALGKACIGPLDRLPKSAGDKLWPLPKGAAEQKQLSEIRSEFEELHSLKNLEGLPLNALGSELRNMSERLRKIYRETDSTVKQKCLSSQSCDDLASTKNHLANRYAWMINSYVDSFVGRWLKANKYEEIATDCGSRPHCYQWKGTYTSGYPY
jgi:hypothetical protein